MNRLLTIGICALSLFGALSSGEKTEEEAAFLARQMVHSYGMGTLITTYPDGQPFGSMDYFADDCPSSGDPLLYLSSMQVSVRNFRQNPRAALAIQSHLNSTDQSPMPHARFTLMGEIRPVPTEELNRNLNELRECFFKKHEEARRWPRGHAFRFYRLHVDRIYWIGGFGGYHYIGPIKPEVYHEIVKFDPQNVAREPTYLSSRQKIIQKLEQLGGFIILK